MGWSIGYDQKWKRDIGYGVPAYCDHPGCFEKIDRGLAFVCGGKPYGGEFHCGLYFCSEHLRYDAKGEQSCERCLDGMPAFRPSPDHPEWTQHKLTDESWAKWRSENQQWVREHSALEPQEPPR